jgi:hypothetical protein
MNGARRSMAAEPLPYRSPALLPPGRAVPRYVTDWPAALTDVTPLTRRIRRLRQTGRPEAAQALRTRATLLAPVARPRLQDRRQRHLPVTARRARSGLGPAVPPRGRRRGP